MGLCSSTPLTDEEKLQQQKNKEINDLLAKGAKLEAAKVKLLLLGTGESGKSTIFKQMKVIYGKPFTEDEKRFTIPTIYANIISSMKILCDQAINLNLKYLVLAQAEFNYIRQKDENSPLDIESGNAIKTLWEDPGIQEVWKRRNLFQIIESVQYYFNRIDIIKLPNYLPDKDDILYSRMRTSGIVTESYVIDDSIFEMYDVGGQRNERKKWIHCFDNVTGVIFIVALSEYDQRLFEDTTTNRMVESLELFDDIINNIYFRKSAFILFLNKRDLFESKIKTNSIRSTPAFSDYSGPEGDYEEGIKYFLNKFISRNKDGANHQIYHHVTCATDTRNIRHVFDACKDIILKKNLQGSGFLEED